jgi:DHA1 family tetracycline resistance protein-like MFS transporter
MSAAPMNEGQLPPKTRRAAVAFIFVTVALDMLALGMVIPVLPKLVESFVGGDTAHASEIFGLFATAWALMQFVFSPLLGALSDRYGRRLIVLVSNFGLGADYILMALAPSLSWLFVGRVISGIAAASVSTGFAYIADVTPPEKRAASFGLISAAFGLGFILGPALGGLLGAIDARMPFWVAALLSLINALYGLLVLPESLPKERRISFDWRRANPVGSLVLLRSHRELLGLAAANFLAYLGHVVLPSVTVLYATYRYGWDNGTMGLTLAAVGVCAVIVQVSVIGPFVRRFGERGALLIGLIFGAAGFAIYGLAPTGPLFWAGIPVMALWGLSGPAVQGLMTRRVSASEQGQLQGANSSITAIANLIGPSIFTLTFAYVIGPGADWQLPGAPFLLAMLMLLASALLAWRVTRPTG